MTLAGEELQRWNSNTKTNSEYQTTKPSRAPIRNRLGFFSKKMARRTCKKDFQIVNLPHLVQNFALSEIPPTMNEMLKMRTPFKCRSPKGFKGANRMSEFDKQQRIWASKIIDIVESKKLIKYREPAWVNLLFFVDERIDDDNLEASRKMLLDAMVESKLIVDDSRKWLRSHCDRQPPLKGKNIKLIVTVSNRQIMKDPEPIKY